ncbi:MAG: hypothetical protein ACI9OJ_005951, partial [Myxococcota bacterium]
GDDTECQSASCDEDAAECTTLVAADGSLCTESACTTGASCTTGICSGGVPIVCDQPLDSCQLAMCDVEAGTCVDVPLVDTAPCDDDDVCTSDDACTAGTCSGTSVVCDTPAGQCLVGVCDPTDGCGAEPAPNGDDCDDGVQCTDVDACDAGLCVGSAKDCSQAGGPCHEASCDESSGSCLSTQKVDGSECADGNPCSVGSFCAAGGCTGGTPKPCNEFDSNCTLGTCNGETGLCQASNLANELDCDDGSNCTTSDGCFSGTCTGEPVPCPVAGPCQLSFCDEATGTCMTELDSAADGSACDDGDFCTVDGFCAEGACVTKPRDCSDQANQCETASCSSGAAECVVMAAVNGLECSDSDPCTLNDGCESGVCSGSPAICPASIVACMENVCEESGNGGTPTCTPQPVVDGTSCDDDNKCTVDVCQGGQCVGTPIDCSVVGEPCKSVACDPATGNCKASAKDDGSACDDGLACTEDDACLNGDCVPGSTADCPCDHPSRSIALGNGCAMFPGAPYLTTAHGFTVEFWLRTESMVAGRLLDQRVTEATGESDWNITYDLAGAAAQLRFHYGNITGNDSKIGMTGVALNDGQWHHVALVRRETFVRWFIDGEGQVVHNTANSQPLSNSAPLWLGCGAFGGEEFTGNIDELRISDFARYVDDFSPPGRHLWGVGTAALWRFDEDPGSLVAADATNQYPGNVQPAAAFEPVVAAGLGSCCGDGVLSAGEACEPSLSGDCTDGCESATVVSQSAEFDGDGCITVEGKNLTEGQPEYTVEFWLKTTVAGPRWLVDARTDPQGGSGFGIRMASDGRVAFVLYPTSNPASELALVTLQPLNDGQWHHLALVARPGDKFRWFVDGTGHPSTLTATSVPNGVDVDWTIGCDSEGNGIFVGQLDGFRVTRDSQYLFDFTPETVLVPGDETRLLLTFDHPVIGGALLDFSAGHHAAAATAGVDVIADAP